MVDNRWKWLDCDICECWEDLILLWGSDEFKGCLKRQWLEEAAGDSSTQDNEGSTEIQSEGDDGHCTPWQLHDEWLQAHQGVKLPITGAVVRGTTGWG